MIFEILKILDFGMSFRIFRLLKIQKKKKKKKKSKKLKKENFHFFDICNERCHVFAKNELLGHIDMRLLLKKSCKNIVSQKSYRCRHLVAGYVFFGPKMGLIWGFWRLFGVDFSLFFEVFAVKNEFNGEICI